MQRKQRIFKRLQLSTLVGFAAVAALDSGLFNGATFAPPSFSNVAFAADAANDETSARDEKTDAILALLDVPEGESGAFYRERLQELQNACARVLDFDAACYNLVRCRDEKGRVQWRRAEPNSLENKVYVAARVLYERLFDAPDLAPEIRDRYFAKYLRDAYYLDRAEDADVQGWLDYCAARLTLEEAREPFPLGRVLALRRQISNAENSLARKASGDAKKTFADFPTLAALTDDLAEKVELERLAAEAEAEAKAKIKAKAEAKVGTSQDAEERLVAFLILADKLNAALPELLADERPAEETTEFYRRRRQELEQITGQLTGGKFNVDVRLVLVSDFLAGKLAYAKDLAPVERFEAFQDYVLALGTERLPALLEQETKRKAEHPADAARVPYLRDRLFAARCLTLLPKNAEETNAPFSEEERAELERFAADALELLDDGPLAWELGQSWATTVLGFLRDFADRIDVDFATQLRKDVLARFPDSEKESNRGLLAWTEKEVREGGFIGSKPKIVGRLASNGEPLDWNSYRGAPVLVEIFRYRPEEAFPWQSNLAFESDAFFKGCVDAGLKVIRYGAGSYEDARRHYEATRPNKPDAPNAIFVDPDSPVVGPVEGREGNDDWALRLGFARFGRAWILFDADGRVVTTFPKPAGLRVYRNAPTLQKALETLYPNVDPKSGAKR
ncbi:MAG: hypothetical protein IJO40_13770 [Thermoguttaceae bacterium]|nr:hypothetical protein [Thermoguttaceae bacterium]